MSNDNLPFLSIRLAIADWFHEASRSFCGVLALASILAPLLIMEGVHNGLVQRMRENLMLDPYVLLMIPASGMDGGFDEAFIEKVSRLPEVRSAFGGISDADSEARMRGPAGKTHVLSLEATGFADPLTPVYISQLPESSPGRLEIVLSHTAAERLATATGQILTANISRRLASGKFRQLALEFHVKAILPPLSGDRNAGYVDMPTLLAIQGFHDGIGSALLGDAGERETPQKSHFASFRAYAQTIDDVPRLEEWFKGEGITVISSAREIAEIKGIDFALGAIIGLIAAAGCAGIFAFMASTVRAAVRRKWQQFGMLRLFGFSSQSILLYPVAQALLTGVLGCVLAFLIYGSIALAIDAFFAENTGGEALCVMPFSYLCLVFAAVQLLAVLAALRSARKAAAISPSAAKREN